jgi:hypothetical protein
MTLLYELRPVKTFASCRNFLPAFGLPLNHPAARPLILFSAIAENRVHCGWYYLEPRDWPKMFLKSL